MHESGGAATGAKGNGMLGTQIKVRDIDDAEGFVRATLQRSKIRFDREEEQELVLEGLCILYELAERYEPHRAGYATSGRFSGFAAQYLPRRLGDAWHRSHPEHQYATDENGKRTWVYHPTPLSLDSVRESNPARADWHARQVRDWIPVTVS